MGFRVSPSERKTKMKLGVLRKWEWHFWESASADLDRIMIIKLVGEEVKEGPKSALTFSSLILLYSICGSTGTAGSDFPSLSLSLSLSLSVLN